MDRLQRESEQVSAQTAELIAQRDLLGTDIAVVRTIYASSGGV